MESVTAVRELENQVRRRMVDVTFTIDPPASSHGSWWIDVQRYGRVASIEWKPGKGFGVAAPNGGYGEGVDFIVDDAATAAEYVARVLQPYSAETDIHGPEGSSVLQQHLVTALATHINRVVGDIVHAAAHEDHILTLADLRLHRRGHVVDARAVEAGDVVTVEKLLHELRKQVGDGPMDLQRVEYELSRITEIVLSERQSPSKVSGQIAPADDEPAT